MNKLAPLTYNQRAYYDRCFESWVNVAEGGKRGSKNVLNTLVFCVMLETHPDRIHLAAGVSIATTKLNILDCNGYGLLNFYEDRCREGTYKNRDCLYIDTLSGEKIVLISGGGKDGDNKLIQGNTYGMAYITEANLCHPTFIKEVFDRTLSSADRKVLHDLNPKGTGHWYYTDVINFHADRQAADPSYGYNYGHFTIADNMSIPIDKVKALLKTYDKNTVWYKRDMLGLRVAAEGLIYDMFNPALHVVPTVNRKYTEWMLSCDYGTQNATSIGLWGYCAGVWYRVREYYYSGRTSQKQKTDEEYHAALVTLAGDAPVRSIIVDPSAASFIATIRRHGRFIPIHANNNVVNGIRFTGSLLKAGKLLINDCCTHLIDEIQGYTWDIKATEDKPIKENDHACDDTRYFCSTHIRRNAYRYGVHQLVAGGEEE